MSKEIVHDIGSMKVIFTPKENSPNEGVIEIFGMKFKDELPEEYINGYPRCYKYDRGTYILIDSNGRSTFGDGSIAGTYYDEMIKYTQ